MPLFVRTRSLLRNLFSSCRADMDNHAIHVQDNVGTISV
jgi:hypothetical protein